MEQQDRGQAAPPLRARGPRNRSVFLVRRARRDSTCLRPRGELGACPSPAQGGSRHLPHSRTPAHAGPGEGSVLADRDAGSLGFLLVTRIRSPRPWPPNQARSEGVGSLSNVSKQVKDLADVGSDPAGLRGGLRRGHGYDTAGPGVKQQGVTSSPRGLLHQQTRDYHAPKYPQVRVSSSI